MPANSCGNTRNAAPTPAPGSSRATATTPSSPTSPAWSVIPAPAPWCACCQLMTDAPAQALDSRFIMECAALGTRLSLQAACYWELPERVIAALDENQRAQDGADSKLGGALQVADIVAMAQVLASHEALPADVDLSSAWPGSHKPAQIKRCQDDLRQHFAADPATAMPA